MNIHPKVAGATIATALSTILLWALVTYAHVELPEAVQLAVVTLVTLLVGYLIPTGDWTPAAPAPNPSATKGA